MLDYNILLESIALINSCHYRTAKQGAEYLVSIGLIKTVEEFLCKNPSKDAPEFIIACIMNE